MAQVQVVSHNTRARLECCVIRGRKQDCPFNGGGAESQNMDLKYV